MPLPATTRRELSAYVNNHLKNLRWHTDYFYFVRNHALRGRLGKEFWSTRAVYKLLEGYQATGALRRAQVKVQVLQYASIYEAVLHYTLFTTYRYHPAVRALRESTWRTNVSVRADLLAKLTSTTRIPAAELRVSREKTIDGDITKVRFDEKVRVAEALNLVAPVTAQNLNELYSARNSIHLHAENQETAGLPARSLPPCIQRNEIISCSPGPASRTRRQVAGDLPLAWRLTNAAADIRSEEFRGLRPRSYLPWMQPS